MSRFQNFVGKKNRGFELINQFELIRGQKFSEVVSFTRMISGIQGNLDNTAVSLESGRHQAWKTGAPIIKGGGVSNKSVFDWRLAG